MHDLMELARFSDWPCPHQASHQELAGAVVPGLHRGCGERKPASGFRHAEFMKVTQLNHLPVLCREPGHGLTQAFGFFSALALRVG